MALTRTVLKVATAALEELKASDIITLDVRKLTTITDMMILCSGRSTRHVKSIAENVEKYAKEKSIAVLSIQGSETSEWVIVDLGNVLIHVMLAETRIFYDLEKLWQIPKRTRKKPETEPEEE